MAKGQPQIRPYTRGLRRATPIQKGATAHHVKARQIKRGPFKKWRQYRADKAAANFNLKQEIKAQKANVKATNELANPELAKLREITGTIKYGLGQTGTQLTSLGAGGITTSAISQNIKGGSANTDNDSDESKQPYNAKKGRDEE